jgi:hypothetical protein
MNQKRQEVTDEPVPAAYFLLHMAYNFMEACSYEGV